jgi:hypothetical protein
MSLTSCHEREGGATPLYFRPRTLPLPSPPRRIVHDVQTLPLVVSHSYGGYQEREGPSLSEAGTGRYTGFDNLPQWTQPPKLPFPVWVIYLTQDTQGRREALKRHWDAEARVETELVPALYGPDPLPLDMLLRYTRGPRLAQVRGNKDMKSL